MAGSYALYRCAVLSTSSGSLSGILDRDSPIQILHLNAFMEQQEFADGLEISNEEYCNWRREHLDSDVSTTPPSSEDLLRTFQYLVGQGYHEAIVTTLSHKLSDSADMVRQVAEQVPQLKVHVVDTGTCCMPEGFFALEADRLLREGKTPTEIVAYLEGLKERCNIIFGLSTIKSLVGSGTMARLGASLCDWLGLRAVLRFSQDQLCRVESTSDDEKMFDAIIDQVLKLMQGKTREQFILGGLYTGERERYRIFAERFFKRTGICLDDGVPVSPVVAVHVGICGVGVGMVEKLEAAA